MSERNEPAADAAKPADDRDEQAKRHRPPSDAAEPDAGKPEAEKPEAEKPAVDKLDTEKPDVEKPMVDKADVESSDAERSVEKSGVDKLDVEKSDAGKSGADKPGDDEKPVETPGVDKPDVEQPMVDKADVESSDAERSVEKSGVDKLDVEKPDAGKSGADKPDVEKPDVEKAGVDKAEAEKLGAEKQDVTGSNASKADSDDADGDQGAEQDKALPVEEVRRYDCSVPEQRTAGLADAASAIRQGKLVVIPTDTVYGIGADAFTPSAVNALLAAKGRGRDMPVPVLVGTVRAANALVDDLGLYGQDLIDAFWPGPLTIICHATRSLRWDLGETKGTVAVRMPLHPVALELLKDTGPMAVSSANRSGAPPATTAAEAEEQLGASVAVYLDGGRCTDATPSTIVDLTTPVPRVLRKGAIPVEKLKGIVGYVATDE